MPEDYEDSGLRELIEQEAALRATGDAGLQRLIEDNTSLINDTNEALGAERATRADQVAKINADLKTEETARQAGDSDLQAQIDAIPAGVDIDTYTADQKRQDDALSAERAARIENVAELKADVQQEADARERGDSDLQAQIDALEVPEDFEETIERIDNDIKVTNEKVDFNAEETLKDQERQDKELEDYKLEVTADQERQDDALKAEADAREAADADLQTQIDAIDLSGSGGAAFLDDLLDVDLNPTRSSFVVVENEFTWLHYKIGTPDAGEISNSGDALVLHKQAWGGIDPSDLINRIEPGTIMAFRGIIPGTGIDEQGTVVSITSKGNTWQITFKEKLAFLSVLIGLGFSTEAVNLSAGYAGHDSSVGPDPGPGPGPGPTPPGPGDPVTKGRFLGFDDARNLWVPQTLDVSGVGGGSGVDPADYYTKTEVDDLINDIDTDVSLDDYYTKAEVDALENAQNARLDALELGSGSGGGGTGDLSAYYTKAETYSKTEVDDLIADIDTNVNLDNYYTKDETYDKRSVDNMVGIEATYRVQGDEALQDQIDDLKANGGSGKDLEPQVNANTAGVLKNKQDIDAINVDQANQDRALKDLESAVLAAAAGLENRYTKAEVDEKIDELDIPEDFNAENLLAKDEDNKVTSDFRIASAENTDTFISFHNNELGLYNLRSPDHAHHAVSKGYADEHDRETLQAAKDYADNVDGKLDDYYTKDEVDASQAAQDSTASDLADAVGAMGAKVDKNAVDIEAIEASSVENLNDLSDVSMSTRARWKTRNTVGQEELSYSCQFKGYNKNSGRITDGNWGIEHGVLFLSKTVFFGSEADDLYANLLVGNKIYLQANHANINLPKQPDRATLTSIDDLGNCFAYTFDDQLADLEAYMGRTWDIDSEATLQVALSEIVVVPDVPEEPDTPTNRTDIVLGYDQGSKLWKPHKSDYLHLLAAL